MSYSLRCFKLMILAFTVSGGLVAPMASAQLKPEVQLGSRIPVKPTAVDSRSAGVIKKGFARCLFAGHKSNVFLVLNNSDMLSINHEKVGIKSGNIGDFLGMSNCLGLQANDTQNSIGMKLSFHLLRSMLAEEAYLARMPTPPNLPSGSLEQVARVYVSQAEKLPSAMSMARFADCLVFNNVVGADAVLRTIPESDDERRAAQALAPAFGRCLVQGQTLSLKPVNIRAFAADGLWNRFARAAEPTATR